MDDTGMLKDFTGASSDSIIAWIIINNPHLTEDKEQQDNPVVYRVVRRQQRYEVLRRQKWICNHCHCRLKYSIHSEWGGEVAHIDHIHPFSERYSYRNGVDNINESENLQGLCPKCNLSKSAKRIN